MGVGGGGGTLHILQGIQKKKKKELRKLATGLKISVKMKGRGCKEGGRGERQKGKGGRSRRKAGFPMSRVRNIAVQVGRLLTVCAKGGKVQREKGYRRA